MLTFEIILDYPLVVVSCYLMLGIVIDISRH
jgi:hypothetical protein